MKRSVVVVSALAALVGITLLSLLRTSQQAHRGEPVYSAVLDEEIGPEVRTDLVGSEMPLAFRKDSGAATQRSSPDVVDSSRLMHDQEYAIRYARHKAVNHLLVSPALESRECREIAALCQKHGLGVWAVSGAYELSYTFHRLNDDFSYSPGTSAEAIAFVEMARDDLFRERVRRIESTIDVRFNPALVEELKRVHPTVFFGTFPLATTEGTPLQDQISWEEVPGILRNASAPQVDSGSDR
ncbi:MAG: hypothetical protein H7A45_18275 [Verrucomicrobiales bacterium]|nr:hypothetical protein [Verrucomicrobiales bacterium]MCP5526616.1 hypothetical protein [Verrucomicrobiales bacterium]